MQVEVLIYGYLAVCVAMIIFNIICIFYFKHSDNHILIYSADFKKRITEQIKSGKVDDSHLEYLEKKLCHSSNLQAFDVTLSELDREHHDSIRVYLHKITPVFVSLTKSYSHKNEIKAAYFPYIIQKYQIFDSETAKEVIDILLELVHSPSIYARENSLHAIYSIGNIECVIKALRIVDNNDYYHNKKLITDGLLSFSGDSSQLNRELWKIIDEFSVVMQTTLMDYFRFSGRDCDEEMLERLSSDKYDKEIRFSAIRYFGKYYCEASYEKLAELAETIDESNWEYQAIASFALANYPCDRTTDILKRNLNSRVWYVRVNASQSLERLGFDYADLIDVFESNDRYAGEMMRYRLDRKKLLPKEA
jgi:hypothetical protein